MYLTWHVKFMIYSLFVLLDMLNTEQFVYLTWQMCVYPTWKIERQIVHILLGR